MTPDAHPILIVGAGPVGLLLAHLLGRQGLTCVLIDKQAPQASPFRAFGFTPASLSILKTAGLYADFEERGVKIRRVRVLGVEGELGVLDFGGLPTEFPFLLSLPQAEAVSVLADRLIDLRSVSFCPGIELRGLAPEGNRVRTLLAVSGSNHTQPFDAAWVIGCDGADSRVRALAGIPVTRHAGGPEYVMADDADRTDWGAEARLYAAPDGPVESIPLPGGRRRWVAWRPPARRGEPPMDFLVDAVKRASGARLSGVGRADDTAAAPGRMLADAFGKGRVLLAGDAAHVMSPLGGQGLNTGFGDADYLAAALPLLKDPAQRDRLTEDYDRNRREAFRRAGAKAAANLWLGGRAGAAPSILRSYFFSWSPQSPPAPASGARAFALPPPAPQSGTGGFGTPASGAPTAPRSA